jgi:hypothetical protein
MKKFMFPLAFVVLMLTPVAVWAAKSKETAESANAGPTFQIAVVNATGLGPGTFVTFNCPGLPNYNLYDQASVTAQVDPWRPRVNYLTGDRGWQYISVFPGCTVNFFIAPDGRLSASAS